MEEPKENAELWVTIVTGFNDANPNNKYIEFEFKKGVTSKKVTIAFDKLEKFPLNNTPVFTVKGRTKATPDELKELIEGLNG